jgi:hypothetical protein
MPDAPAAFLKKGIMNFLCFEDKNNKSILFIYGMASTAMLCYESILKRLSDYYVILAEVDGHSGRTGELVCTAYQVFLWEQQWLSRL